jgi:hypothetical protein
MEVQVEYIFIVIALAVGLCVIMAKASRSPKGAQQIKNRHARRGMHGSKRR